MKLSLIAASLLCVASLAAHAAGAPAPQGAGPYAGIDLGRSNLTMSGPLSTVDSDKHGNTFKLYGGYQIDETFGVEAGYTNFGRFGETVRIGGATVQQDAKARSFWAVGTTRLPLGDAFGVHGRLGASFGKVTGDNVLPASASLMGTKTSLLAGIGVDYKLTSNLTLTADVDHYGKLSDNVKANTLTIGAKFSF